MQLAQCVHVLKIQRRRAHTRAVHACACACLQVLWQPPAAEPACWAATLPDCARWAPKLAQHKAMHVHACACMNASMRARTHAHTLLLCAGYLACHAASMHIHAWACIFTQACCVIAPTRCYRYMHSRPWTRVCEWMSCHGFLGYICGMCAGVCACVHVCALAYCAWWFSSWLSGVVGAAAPAGQAHVSVLGRHYSHWDYPQ